MDLRDVASWHSLENSSSKVFWQISGSLVQEKKKEKKTGLQLACVNTTMQKQYKNVKNTKKRIKQVI